MRHSKMVKDMIQYAKERGHRIEERKDVYIFHRPNGGWYSISKPKE